MDLDLQRAYQRLREAAHGLQEAEEALTVAAREHRLSLELVDIYERRGADSATPTQSGE